MPGMTHFRLMQELFREKLTQERVKCYLFAKSAFNLQKGNRFCFVIACYVSSLFFIVYLFCIHEHHVFYMPQCAFKHQTELAL